ncbi:MAG TPA: PilZ domain-containing protein [Terriglobales bacterium]|nr:PilZ domain-containing protein [Terriglobales bacterium]
MTASAEIKALVVTRDTGLAAVFTLISGEFGISAQPTGNNRAAFPEELMLAKYEAVLIDYETVPQTTSILTQLRENPTNKNAVVFAVVGTDDSRRRARDQGATFLLERPLKGDETRRVLHAAYGLMTRERRRYFRCVAEITVRLVRDSGEEVLCKTLNISSNGMAVCTPGAFQAGEKVHVSFVLPGATSQMRARGSVIWDDRHGKTGIGIECATAQMQLELDSFLDANFNRVLGNVN